jgi:hypothetical protein
MDWGRSQGRSREEERRGGCARRWWVAMAAGLGRREEVELSGLVWLREVSSLSAVEASDL